jgi:hypothetical protein
MKNLLIGKFGFDEEEILILGGAQAKRDAIIQAFRSHLIGRSGAGTVAVFYYAGHGSQMRDAGNDEDDGLDETIVPQDSRKPGVYDLTDDELNGLLTELTARTKNVTVVLDCCHSGDGTRGAVVRRVDPGDRPPPVESAFSRPEPHELPTAVAIAPPQECAVIAACRSGETAWEWTDPDGQPSGVFTYFLVRALQSDWEGVTYRDVMDRVGADVGAFFPDQHPQLQGGRSNSVVFGGDMGSTRPYVLTSTEENGVVVIEAGRVHGMTAGSEFTVFLPGTRNFDDPSRVVAKVELVTVDTDRSRARRLTGGPVSRASRAVETRHRYVGEQIRVFFDGSGGSVLPGRVRDRVVGSAAVQSLAGAVQPVDDPARARLIVREDLRTDGAPSLVIEGGDGTRLSNPVPTQAHDAVDRVAANLADWVRWYRLLMVENTQPGLKVDFTVTHVSPQPVGKIAAEPNGFLTLSDGEAIRFEVVNRSDRPISFAILDLSSNGTIEVVYPNDGPGEQIPTFPHPKSNWQRETTVRVEGLSRVRDYLKLIATQRPVDFRYLRQGPIRDRAAGPESYPLAELLGETMLTGRGGDSTRVALEGWTTRTVAIEVVTPLR